jgi:type IV pilus assembly protein PilM
MKLFSRKSEIFGLDIGSSAVKVVQLDDTPNGYVLKTYAIVPLPPQVVADGVIKDPPVVIEAIKEAVAKAKLKTTDAAIAVSGRELTVKKVHLPKVPRKELDDAVQLEAEHHIPFAIDEVFLDYQVVAETATAMELLLVAAKRSKVSEYAGIAEGAGVNAVLVDLDGFALENQHELNHADQPPTDAVALIDIGASVMKTNVIRGGTSIFARDIPFGGNNYTQAIAQRLNIPFEKAEAAKLGQDVGVNWDDIIPSLEAVSRDLSMEVQRTFDYFASTAESERITKIVLSGGCCRLAGLD